MTNGVPTGTKPRRSSSIEQIERKQIEPSSGNVFADLDLPAADEALAKAELARRICDILAERKLTQARASALLEIDQPKVSALMRGKLAGFSTDRLFRFLNTLGQDVEIVVRPARRTSERASTRVVNR